MVRTNQDSTIYQLQLISEIREEAIATAKENCQKLKNYITYGVPSVIDRMPNTSSSILKSSGSANPHDIKCEVITAEQNDYDFIHRMRKLICSLPDTYKNTFVSIFIDGKSIRSFHRNDIYTILKRGYLKLALLDATIDYSAEDEMKYQNYKLSHKTKKTKIIKKMKAKLFELRSLTISGAVKFERDEFNQYTLINLSVSEAQFIFYSEFVKWINELHVIKSHSMNSKEAIMKYITDVDWKYLDTSDRRSLTKGLLALAYLDNDIDYTYEELKYDAIEYSISTSFLISLKNFQFQLPI